MAFQTSLSRYSRALSGAIRRFAESEGWGPDEYAAVASFDPKSEFTYITVGSVRPVDSYRWHAGIKREIRETFGAQTSSGTQNVLVIRNLENLDQIHDHRYLDEDEIDLTDML